MHRSPLKLIVLVLILLSGLMANSAQAQRKALHFQSYTKDDGLLHSYLLSACQDNYGHLWVGGYSGLNRFDGKTFKAYTTQQVEGLISNAAHHLAASPQDTSGVFVGTDIGLVRISIPEQKASSFRTRGRVHALMTDRDGSLWVVLDSHLYHLAPTNFKVLDSVAVPRGAVANCLYQDQKGQVWIGASEGLFQFQGDTIKRIGLPQEEVSNVSTLTQVGTALILGIDRKLWSYYTKDDLWEVHPANQALSKYNPQITGISQLGIDQLFIATHGHGLFLWQNGILTRYMRDDCFEGSLASDLINGTFKDAFGNLWLYTNGGGLSYMNRYGNRFEHWLVNQESNRFRSENVTGMVIDGDQNRWLATAAKGVFLYDASGDLKHHLSLSNKRQNQIRCLERGADDNVYAGTNDGVVVWDANGTSQSFNQGLPIGMVFDICVQGQVMWVAIFDQGLFTATRQDGKWSSFSQVTGFPTSKIWDVTKDPSGKLWFSTAQGLYSSIDGISFEKVLSGNFNQVYFGPGLPQGIMLAGTFGQGLMIIDRNTMEFAVLSQAEGLCHNNVNAVVTDPQGIGWVSTGKGLAKVDFRNLANDNVTSAQYSIINYTKADGLQGNEFNIKCKAQLSTGEWLFGGANGISVVPKFQLPSNIEVYPSVLEALTVNHASIPVDGTTLAFNHDQRSFSFDLGQVAFAQREASKFMYKLHPIDQEWHEANLVNGALVYHAVPAGEYRLEAYSVNGDGVQSVTKTMLAFSIEPIWYDRMGVRMVGVGLLVIIVLTGVRLRVKRQEGAHRQQMLDQLQQHETEKLEAELENKSQQLVASAASMVEHNERLIALRNQLSSMRPNQEIKQVVEWIDQALNDQEGWKRFEVTFNQLDHDFIRRLTERYSSLTANDVKICTYMRMNLSSKEIASLLNITLKSLETTRLRIRKKMDLDTSEYLQSYLLKF